MSDLIDRQEALKALSFAELGMECEAIEALPSAEPEIIRCKDCKKHPNWEWVGCPMTGAGTRKPDDFCSYAERRTDD